MEFARDACAIRTWFGWDRSIDGHALRRSSISLKQAVAGVAVAGLLAVGPQALGEEKSAEGTFTSLASALADPAKAKVIEITQPDPEIDRLVELRAAVNLERLTLHHNGLTEFPDLSNLPNLIHVDLSYNAFDHVPSSVTDLTRLESFAMFENRLRDLPASIRNLKKLNSLFIGMNPDLDVADAVVQLQPLDSLTMLGFGGIKMSELPKEIGELRSLKLLWIANTGLSSLPHSLAKLEELESLVLTGCSFETLPKVVESLPSLQQIVLKDVALSQQEIERIETAMPAVKLVR